MAYETFIGFRYLKTKQRSTFISIITLISIIGVTLGVATLTVVLSVMNGFQEELIKQVIGANSHGILFRFGIDFSDHDDIQKKLHRIKGVQSASPIVLGEVMLSFGKKMVGVGMKGIDLTRKKHFLPLIQARTSKKGDLQKLHVDQPDTLPGIAIGKSLAQHLHVKHGDVINMISPVSLFGMNYRPQATHQSFRVVYIFQFGMHQYDSKFCFIELTQAQKFLNMKQSVTGIEILVEDIHNIGYIKQSILGMLGGWPYRFQDWRQMNQNLFKAIQQNKMALGLVLLFIILVASLNIAGTLILMVLEKSNDIAILRAMGSSRKSIIRIFMTYGLYIGSLGTLTGLLLGIFTCKLANRIDIQLDAEIYFISHLPVRIDALELAIISICSLFISFLAAVYPAIQAAKQNPVEVLRYE